ncbi:PadR family transcriptional regulator [Nocardiopsis sp. CNR-923]|uniref:PadR family transcriptional regulator n=1 Tax=Nocardiopsis sp. CNR-923 TaxID=1904965 RepID=UPI00095A1C9D|nr:helix-turn-helix transcriptional regulator [Nocardiopsis sp. CNR-923]OLT28159.1 PadR family transcriptional regulator [Nocardiopsis sp. CNR-923]
MSTIFGHGRLRLYLLKLLDESPRHGYEIISLLRDRFLGVYSPSPGTVYPRLSRLEEEGLVTHTEEGGRKVYRLTDKGRQELRERSGDLNDLEREITDSVRDVARAVKQDVRATIGSLREELKYAARGARRPSAGAAGGGAPQTEPETPEDADGPATATGGEPGADEGRHGGDQRERSCEGGPWAREWERFAQGFSGAFGAAWGRGSDRSHTPEFDQALREFSERVRDVVREAGHVGEAAATDLRRILDDTVEVIRRDVRRWGPPRDRAEEDGREEDEEGKPAEGAEGADAHAGPAAGRPRPEEPAEEARPMPPVDGGTAADPWGTAVSEQEGGDDRTGDTKA